MHILFLSINYCLSVCLYPINVKTAEPIPPKFCVGPHMTPEKVLNLKKKLVGKVKKKILMRQF